MNRTIAHVGTSAAMRLLAATPFRVVGGLAVIALVAAGCSSPKEAAKTTQPTATPSEPQPAIRLALPPADPIASHLDSLVDHSQGNYVHIVISQCFGRCEGHISISRETPAKFHVYDAEAYRYDEFERGDILYRMRKPMSSDVAEELMTKAYQTGIMKLVADTTHFMTDQPYIWVRARYGDEIVSVNHAYLGGVRYAGDGRTPGLSDIYARLRVLLLGPLFNAAPADVERTKQ